MRTDAQFVVLPLSLGLLCDHNSNVLYFGIKTISVQLSYFIRFEPVLADSSMETMLPLVTRYVLLCGVSIPDSEHWNSERRRQPCCTTRH